jgi:cyclopropane-fatty-acyl-phospholipid synthase
MAHEQVVSSVQTIGDPVIDAARTVLTELFGPPDARGFRVQLWDGSVEGLADGQAPFTLILRRPGALRRMLLPPSELALGEAYLRDDFDVTGSMEAATGLAELITERLRSPARLARFVPLLRSLPTDDIPDETDLVAGARTRLIGLRHSRGRDRAAVRAHYDAGNDFYALWLDQRMVYSCAYFEDEATDLDNAQLAKLDHICRKLRLRPGERLLDIGCGWGALVMHAAERYGVDATGITLSEPQAALARERIAAAGLANRCRVEVRDYRELPPGTTFDKIASVGMVEHVGRAKLDAYFAEAHRLLRPGGLFLNHGIVSRSGRDGMLPRSLRRLVRPRSFIDRYVFPDGELVGVEEIVAHAERAGFETRDVEALREHYALTLRHWVRRLEAAHDRAGLLVGESTYRVWRLYMSGSAHGFATGRLSVMQTLLAKPMPDGGTRLPITRSDIYRAMDRNDR